MNIQVPRPLLRYHGGKWRLASWIVKHFPPHRAYVEPFGGGASVLLRKERSYAEVYNDLDGEIVNLFTVARDHGEALIQAVELTPFARAEFNLSFLPAETCVERARRTLVRSFMGYGCNLTRMTRAGRLERTGFRSYSKKNRRSIPSGDWRNWPCALPVIIDRLRGVIIEQRDACEVMLEHDGHDTLHYVDPPYVHSMRGKKQGYRFEMDDGDHARLSEFLHSLRGMVVLSGYNCPLYNSLFKDWRRRDVRSYADGARPRIESLWLSPAVEEVFR